MQNGCIEISLEWIKFVFTVLSHKPKPVFEKQKKGHPITRTAFFKSYLRCLFNKHFLSN